MGKRKNKDPAYIKKKIRKLEKKLEKIPIQIDSEVSSPPCSPLARSQSSLSSTPLPPVAQPNGAPSPPAQNDLEPELNTENKLPEDLLQALGTEGEEDTEVGEAIRPELVLRWTRIMQMGLGKESREAISRKYPTPINFPRVVAPIMNAEISASQSEATIKRDKRICQRQNLMGKLITCLGKSLSKVLLGNLNSKVLVEEISDAAKLAAEIHYQDSTSRKFFALAGVNKVVQDAVRTTTPDETLFGSDCAEKIRAAQAIQKAGSTIKTTNQERKSLKTGTQKKQENWRGLPQYQQQRTRGGHQNQQYQHQRQSRPNQARWKTQKSAPLSSKSRYRR